MLVVTRRKLGLGERALREEPQREDRHDEREQAEKFGTRVEYDRVESVAKQEDGSILLKTSGGTAHSQGLVTQAFVLTTTASTAINSNLVTVASTAALSVGQALSGNGVPTGATIAEVTSGTTFKMSAISTAGIANGASVYVGDTSGKLWLPNTTLTTSQVVTVTRTFTAPGA